MTLIRDRMMYEASRLRPPSIAAQGLPVSVPVSGPVYEPGPLRIPKPTPVNIIYDRAKKYYQSDDVKGWMPKKMELKFKDSYIDFAAGDPITKEDIVRWQRGYFTQADFKSTGLTAKQMKDIAVSVSFKEGWKEYNQWLKSYSQYEPMTLEDAKKLFKPDKEAIARGQALPDDVKRKYDWYVKQADKYFMSEHTQKAKAPRPYEAGSSVELSRTQADLNLEKEGLLNEHGLPKAEYLISYYGEKPGANITQRNSKTFDYYATLEKYAKETGTPYWEKQSAGQPISKGKQGGYSQKRETTKYKPYDGSIDTRWLGKFGTPAEIDTGLQNIAAFNYKDKFYDTFGRIVDLDQEPKVMPKVYTAGLNLDQMIKRDQEALKSGNMTGFSRPTGHNYFSIPGYGSLFNQSTNTSNQTKESKPGFDLWIDNGTSTTSTTNGTTTKTSEKKQAPVFGLMSSTTTMIPNTKNAYTTTTTTSSGTRTITSKGYEEEQAKTWSAEAMGKSMVSVGYLAGSYGVIASAPVGGTAGLPSAAIGALAGGFGYNVEWLTRNYAPEFTKDWKLSLPSAIEIPVPWGGSEVKAFKDMGLPQSKLLETLPILQKDWDLPSAAGFVSTVAVLGAGGKSQVKGELGKTKTTANVKIREQGVFNEAGASEAMQRIEASIESKNIFGRKTTTLKAPEGLGGFNVKEGSLMTDSNYWSIYTDMPGQKVISQAKGVFGKQSKGIYKQNEAVFIDFLEQTKPKQRVIQSVKKAKKGETPEEITTWNTADIEAFSPTQIIGKDKKPILEPVKLKGFSQQVNRAYPSRSVKTGKVIENPLPNQPILEVNAGRGQVFLDKLSVRDKSVPGKMEINYDYISRKVSTKEPLLSDTPFNLNPEDITFNLKPKTKWKPEKTDLYHKDLWEGIVSDARKIYGKPKEATPKQGTTAILKDYDLITPVSMESKAASIGAYGHLTNIKAMSKQLGTIPYIYGGIGALSSGSKHIQKKKDKQINVLSTGAYTQTTQKPRTLSMLKESSSMRDSLKNADKQTNILMQTPARALKTNLSQKRNNAITQTQAIMKSMSEAGTPKTKAMDLTTQTLPKAFVLPKFDLDTERRIFNPAPIKTGYRDRYYKWGNLIKLGKKRKAK